METFSRLELLLGILGVCVPLGFPNPDPISDQKMPFFTYVFRSGHFFSLSSQRSKEAKKKNK